jgi:hypothetical protein
LETCNILSDGRIARKRYLFNKLCSTLVQQEAMLSTAAHRKQKIRERTIALPFSH